MKRIGEWEHPDSKPYTLRHTPRAPTPPRRYAHRPRLRARAGGLVFSRGFLHGETPLSRATILCFEHINTHARRKGQTTVAPVVMCG